VVFFRKSSAVPQERKEKRGMPKESATFCCVWYCNLFVLSFFLLLAFLL